jgi:acetoin utilization deacetylase AcuC-like enzyme
MTQFLPLLSTFTMIVLHSSKLATRNTSLCLFSTQRSIASSRPGLDPAQNRFHAPIVYHENYSFADWPPNHTFPMDKFGRLAEAVLTKGRHLPRPLVRQESDLFRPYDMVDVPREWFAEPTGPIEAEFLDRFLGGDLTYEEKRYIGFREQTDRPELMERTVLEVAGTVLAAQLATHYGIASNLAGGTHHAHRDMGAGYTILNDLAVTANFLTDEELNQGSVTGIERVLVVDCDVHQGDGTAKFTKLHDDQRLFTLSIHCASNYPRLKAHSTYDIGVVDGLKDDEYMETLRESVNKAIAEVDPDFVLYDAGVDIYEHDKLGRLKVTEEGIRQRDRFVLDRCVSAGIPVAAVIGGGYDKDVDALARRHAIVHEECAFLWRKHNMWKRVGVEGV